MIPVRLDHVSFQYTPHSEPVVREVSLHLQPGDILCLCGCNGSGKSTLLSLMAGLLTPNSGTISMGALTSPGQEQELRSITSLMLQDPELQIIGSTVEEDLLLSVPKGNKDDTTYEALCQAARDTACGLGLAHVLDAPVHTLSHGQKRKLCMATAQLLHPQVLLMDEPFSGLDYPAVLEMRSILRSNRRKGLVQVAAVHDLECLADLADMYLVLAKGVPVRTGNAEEVLDHVAEYGVRPPCSWSFSRTLTPLESHPGTTKPQTR